MKRGAVAFGSGVVFATGLCLSGMTQPSKVTGFLDVTGAWDPSLAFVMVGAIAVTAVGFRLSARRAAPFPDDRFHVPPARSALDWRVIAGAAIFGLGWGLSGLCPGPAIVSLVSGQRGALVFVTAMIVGMFANRAVVRVGSREGAEGEERSRPGPVEASGRAR
jgi:uncharacterized protein